MTLEEAAAILNITAKHMGRLANTQKRKYKPKLVQIVQTCDYHPRFKKKVDGKMVPRAPYSRRVMVLHVDGKAVRTEAERRKQ